LGFPVGAPGLAGQVQGGPAHPPLPFPRRHAEQRPVVAAAGLEAVEEVGVRPPEVRFQGEDANGGQGKILSRGRLAS
jgi:hypothetical protein